MKTTRKIGVSSAIEYPALFTPKYMADAYSAYMGKDVENQKYQQAVLDVYNMRVAHYYEDLRAGKKADPPKMSEIQRDAKNFLWLQTLTDWLSPVSVKNTPMPCATACPRPSSRNSMNAWTRT